MKPLLLLPLLLISFGRSDPLALRLASEGQHRAAAVEFRRLALNDEPAGSSDNWFWLAAYQYTLDGQWERSNRMLDRAEDVDPDEIAPAIAWLRAENSLGERDWPAAAFHFDSLRQKAADGPLRIFAIRSAAAAHLYDGSIRAAQAALTEEPEATPETLAIVGRYAQGHDKRPWVGGLLGLVPGLGYAYSGEYANAARSLILNSLFLWAMVETGEREEWGLFAVTTFAEFTWYSGSIYGGIDAAQRYNRRRLEEIVYNMRGELRPKPDFTTVPIVTLKFDF